MQIEWHLGSDIDSAGSMTWFANCPTSPKDTAWCSWPLDSAVGFIRLQGEQAAVNFVVQNQQAKDALEQNMHKLRDMLAEQGVDVGDASVEQQNQQNTQSEGQSEKQNSIASSLNNNAVKDSELHVLSANLFNSSATGVDYYA